MKGYIVLLDALCGEQPVFREEEDRLMFFNSIEEAQAEIDELIDVVRDAVSCGNMEDEYDAEEYIIAEAEIDEHLITCTYNGIAYQMLDTDENWKPIINKL